MLPMYENYNLYLPICYAYIQVRWYINSQCRFSYICKAVLYKFAKVIHIIAKCLYTVQELHSNGLQWKNTSLSHKYICTKLYNSCSHIDPGSKIYISELYVFHMGTCLNWKKLHSKYFSHSGFSMSQSGNQPPGFFLADLNKRIQVKQCLHYLIFKNIHSEHIV